MIERRRIDVFGDLHGLVLLLERTEGLTGEWRNFSSTA